MATAFVNDIKGMHNDSWYHMMESIKAQQLTRYVNHLNIKNGSLLPQ
jgi:hypothetical protein